MSEDSDPARDLARDSDNHNPFIAFRRLVDHHLSSAIRLLNEQAGMQPSGDSDGRTQHIQASPYMTSNAEAAPDESRSRLFGIFLQPPLHDRAMTQSSSQGPSKHTKTGKFDLGWRELKVTEEEVARDGKYCRRRSRKEREHESQGYEKDTTADELLQALGVTTSTDGQSDHEAWWWNAAYSPDQLVTDQFAPDEMRDRWHPAFADLLAHEEDEEVKQQGNSQAAAGSTETRRQFLEKKDQRYTTCSGSTDVKRSNVESPVLSLMKQLHFFGDETKENSTPTTRTLKATAAVQQPSHETEQDMYRWFLDRQADEQPTRSRKFWPWSTSSPQESQGPEQAEDARERLPLALVDYAIGQVTQTMSQVARETEKVLNPASAYTAQFDSSSDDCSENTSTISLVTQSYTTVQPDGSSRTTRRIKRTFPDGREEYSEDVSEQPASVRHDPSQKLEQQEKSSGWFWRS